MGIILIINIITIVAILAIRRFLKHPRYQKYVLGSTGVYAILWGGIWSFAAIFSEPMAIVTAVTSVIVFIMGVKALYGK